MDTFLGRYRNLIVLAAILFAQIIGLAVQVRRPTQEGETRLIRLWAVSAVTPLESAVVHSRNWVTHLWTNYLYLRGVRRENRELRAQIQRLDLEQVRLREDADMARRIQALLAFKEQYINSTVAAQVIGTSGSDQSRVLYIDKGSNDGIQNDMAVITPAGIVGKIVQVFPDSSQVLPINDQFSGVGVALKDSRLQGILKGGPDGTTTLQYIMSDETVKPGEEVITSGGDRIFPKGLPVGKVVSVQPGKDLFLNIRVAPAAHLGQLEEVLVVTKITEKMPETQDLGPIRASDILAQRLPSVPNNANLDAAGNAKPGSAAGAAAGSAPSPPATANATVAHPATTGTPEGTPNAAGAGVTNRPAGAAASSRTSASGAAQRGSTTAKPTPATNLNGVREPSAKPPNRSTHAVAQPNAEGTKSTGETPAPTPQEAKPAPEAAPRAPASQPSTSPTTGAPPQP